MAALESELAVLREVVAERDRLLQEVRELRAEALLLREQVAPPGPPPANTWLAQLQDTKAELKESREDGRQLQAELLGLARHDGEGEEMTGKNITYKGVSAGAGAWRR